MSHPMAWAYRGTAHETSRALPVGCLEANGAAYGTSHGTLGGP